MVRKFVIALVLGTGFFVMGGAVDARGLYFKNLTSEDIYVAVANHESGGWRIDGWYKVRRGQTFRVISGGLNNRYYYYYAYTASKRNVWRGNHRFYIHPTRAFTILRVNGNYGALPSGARMEGFRQIDTGATSQHHTVTLY